LKGLIIEKVDISENWIEINWHGFNFFIIGFLFSILTKFILSFPSFYLEII